MLYPTVMLYASFHADMVSSALLVNDVFFSCVPSNFVCTKLSYWLGTTSLR